jgi:Domain of unknown function (DUF4878)
MKWSWIIAGTILFCSCSNEETFSKAEDAEDAGTEFIRASLDGNYEKAKFYMYLDSAQFNIRLLDKWRADYETMAKEEKSRFKSSSIRPIEIVSAGDSNVYSYTYFNSYKKDTTTIRILKVNGEWLVDLRDLH